MPGVTSPQKQVENLLVFLRIVMQVRGLSSREAERRLGLPVSSVSRVLSGQIEPKLIHVFWICEAAGVDPAEFFQTAYAHPPRTRELETLREILGLSPPSTAPMSPEDIEKLVREILRASQEGDGP